MKPDSRFLNQDARFWANVRAISAVSGYKSRPTVSLIIKSFDRIGLSKYLIIDADKNLTSYGELLMGYLDYRYAILERVIEPNLMDAEAAKEVFERLYESMPAPVSVQMNKQKGEKRKPAYFTNIINYTIEHALGCKDFIKDPKQLSILTNEKSPEFVFSRRFDGVYPSLLDPIAFWEIKEYYHTTTFGSRVADGVYESQLDGYEVQMAVAAGLPKVLHYIMVDSRTTFWLMGKSYLCRFVDMLHMRIVDEVLFGREVISELPRIVNEWLERSRSEH